ncbi:MAG: tetratricopeptide repeat protein [Planctomycetes bacterium]|nr:tetratricopeptide repeat protein [Planctomycetota bacterium]
MKIILFFLLSLLLSAQAFSQGQLKGVVLYQNSGGSPVAGVKINAFGASHVYTDNGGMFELSFGSKNPGDNVKIIIGGKDEKSKNIEVVNNRELENAHIPSDPDNAPLEIIVCPTGQRDQTALRYYGILTSATNDEYEQRLNRIDQQLRKENLDPATTAALREEMDELREGRDAALKKVEEQAQFIASINKDRASDLVKSAIQKIEEEKDIESALKVLDSAKLEEAYQLAIEKKLNAEAEIKQVIEGYELKISLLLPKFRYKEAAFCYERIIEIYETNQFSMEYLAVYYENMALVLYDDGKRSNALQLQKKSIAIREEILDPKHPSLATSYNNIALTYQDLGDYNKALQFQKISIAIREEILDPKHPSLATSYGNIASTYRALGDYNKALQFQKNSVKIIKEALPETHPYQQMAFNTLLKIYYEKGVDAFDKKEYKRALIDFETLNTYKTNSNAINLAGLCHYYLKDYQNAIENYQKAAELDHKVLTDNFYNNIGMAYAKNGQFDDAEHAFREYQKLFPDSGRAYRNWAMFYALKGDKEISISNLQKSIELGYDNLDWVTTDDGLESIRMEKLYLQIVAALQKKLMTATEK